VKLQMPVGADQRRGQIVQQKESPPDDPNSGMCRKFHFVLLPGFVL
jgi:hypothetical protein